jgi:hypothetical protein
MVINAADYGVDLEDETTDEEDREEMSGEDSDDSEYENYKRKHRPKLRAKKEKEKEKRKKGKTTVSLATQNGKTIQTTGTAEEVSSLIRQLNKMSISDPEYPPVFYKVLALDSTGNAAKCVQPPRLAGSAPTFSGNNATRPREVQTGAGSTGPATFPNNIPLGTTLPPRQENVGCFRCHKEGHRINDCADLQELLRQNIVCHDEETWRLRMNDGSFIKRINGESLVQAAQCLAAVPRVMFVTVDSPKDRILEDREVFTYKGNEAFIEEIINGTEEEEEILPYGSDSESEALDAHWYTAGRDDFEDEDVLGPGEVYLSVPRPRNSVLRGGQVNSADRSVPSSVARREISDGVHVPRRPWPMPPKEVDGSK